MNPPNIEQGVSTGDPATDQNPITRRQFLRITALITAGVLLPGAIARLGSLMLPTSDKEGLTALDNALRTEFGNYEGAVSFEEMIRDCASANVVAVGESHDDPKDMATAGTIIDGVVGTGRRIAIFPERFSTDLSGTLDAIHREIPPLRPALLDDIFSRPEYSSVWSAAQGNSSTAMNMGSGVGVTPKDQEIFEAIMRGAVKNGFEIFSMDVPNAYRSDLRKMEDASRNGYWVNRIKEVKEGSRPTSDNYSFVVMAGERHMGRDSDSFPIQAQANGLGRVVTIGQRGIGSYSLAKLEELARQNSLPSLIIHKPQRIGNVQPFVPGDYWIVTHPIPTN